MRRSGWTAAVSAGCVPVVCTWPLITLVDFASTRMRTSFGLKTGPLAAAMSASGFIRIARSVTLTSSGRTVE